MGYDIYIGEWVTQMPEEEGEEAYDRVDHLRHPDAPKFPNDVMTGNGNARHPSYTGWSNFCALTKLTELFFNKESGLMREHPGIQPLTRQHLESIQASKQWWLANRHLPQDSEPGTNWNWAYKGEFAGLEPGFDPERETDVQGKFDGILARLLWLEWWVDWALKNCKVPAIYNS